MISVNEALQILHEKPHTAMITLLRVSPKGEKDNYKIDSGLEISHFFFAIPWSPHKLRLQGNKSQT